MSWEISPATDIMYTQGCAPSILNLFINMMLFKHTVVDEESGCKEYMFEQQGSLQTVFIVIALICIPWMLLGKPFYIMLTKKTHHVERSNGGIGNDAEAPEKETVFANEQDHGEEEALSEVFIHQSIQTIEYVLSTISNTASYLRLWALSLAHAQLSEVIRTMIMNKGFYAYGFPGGVIMCAAFAAWAAGTISILVCMEGLSAFLHTLRLHWVEFMSKFYQGVGYPFQPFSFTTIMESEEIND